MKYILSILLFTSVTAFGQLSLERAKDSLQQYHLGTSTYFEGFIGHPGYGARVILTNEGGVLPASGMEIMERN